MPECNLPVIDQPLVERLHLAHADYLQEFAKAMPDGPIRAFFISNPAHAGCRRPRGECVNGCVRRSRNFIFVQERIYGIVTGLTQEEIDTLYSEPSVLDYRPEAVLVNLGDGRQVPALCYNLPHVSGRSRNTKYAVRLFEVAKALSLPGEYLTKLQNLAQ